MYNQVQNVEISTYLVISIVSRLYLQDRFSRLFITHKIITVCGATLGKAMRPESQVPNLPSENPQDIGTWLLRGYCQGNCVTTRI